MRDLSEPVWNSVLLVRPHVKVDDGRREKGRQGDEDHVDAEKCTCNSTRNSFLFIYLLAARRRR